MAQEGGKQQNTAYGVFVQVILPNKDVRNCNLPSFRCTLDAIAPFLVRNNDITSISIMLSTYLTAIRS